MFGVYIYIDTLFYRYEFELMYIHVKHDNVLYENVNVLIMK